jgi:hypothetical protein
MLMVNVTSKLFALHIVICEHKICQPEVQVLHSLVEAGVIIHEPSQSGHSSVQSDRGVQGSNICGRESDFARRAEALENSNKIQRVFGDILVLPNLALQLTM